ncbi:MAG: sigma-54-dependent Fis family transcriptional regulator [Gemmatimonadetes bacterium]|nr:sigma-54-dependent Fis family transcriptional regulator [Gemmatimonadota bacterium]
MRVLLVEDDRITRVSLTDALVREGFAAEAVEDGTQGMERARTGQYDVIVTDLRLPGPGGLEVLQAARQANPRCEVVVITAFATVDTAVHALKLGAYDYITKPLAPEKFLGMMRNLRQYRSVIDENADLRRRLELFQNRTVVAEAPAMGKLLETVRQVAQHNSTVLIRGESGTGKEMIARTVHFLSPRRDEPFVAINCAAIPESLLESELFGHEKGAFSGAVQRRKGYFERANGGTIFIDDVDDLPLGPQVKLLRVLQERTVARLGGTAEIPVDVRVICATKVDLKAHVERRQFREDLFYRLNIVPLRIPPLRERPEDLPPLTRHFFEKHGGREWLARLQPTFFEMLGAYGWPGNVRELENFVQRVIATGETELAPAHDATVPDVTAPEMRDEEAGASEYPPFDEYMRQREAEIITWALEKSERNVTQAARLLGMPRGTLRSRLEKLNLDVPTD